MDVVHSENGCDIKMVKITFALSHASDIRYEVYNIKA